MDTTGPGTDRELFNKTIIFIFDYITCKSHYTLHCNTLNINIDMAQKNDMNSITVRNASEFQEIKIPADKIVHLKGFASGINYEQQEEARTATIAFILALQPQMIVWDGDNFGDDSFTALIPMLSTASPDLRFVAFRCTEESIAFQESWKRTSSPNIDLFLVNSVQPKEYVQLASKAWDTTLSSHFVCFGGGKGILDEYTLYRETTKQRSRSIQWSVCPATRTKSTGEVNSASLLKDNEGMFTQDVVNLFMKP